MGIALALYAVLVLVGAPVLSWRTAASGVITTMPRASVYLSAMGTAWFLALLGAGVCFWDGSLSATDLGLTTPGPVVLTGATMATLAGLAAGVALFRRLRAGLGREETAAVRWLVPRTAAERRLYAGVSLTAGLTEEFVFRGIVLTALAGLPALDSAAGPWLAALVVSAGFGLGHGYQDVLGMLRAGTLGYVLAVPFLLTGSLLPGIIAHAALDLCLLTPAGRSLVGMADAAPPADGQDDGDDFPAGEGDLDRRKKTPPAGGGRDEQRRQRTSPLAPSRRLAHV